MKPAPKMRQIIAQLAHKHGVNLDTVGADLRLDMPDYDRLVIRRQGPQHLAVAHFFDAHGSLVPDPAVTFWVQPHAWLPIAITHALTGLQSYVQVSLDGSTILGYHRAKQADLAQFVEVWAQNLIDQGWLEQGIKYEDPVQQLLINRGVLPLFPWGQVVATPGALEALDEAGQTPFEFLARHVVGDWGNLDEQDRQENERSLQVGARLFSAYQTSAGQRLWVITEHDRSVTTLLLPSEY